MYFDSPSPRHLPAPLLGWDAGTRLSVHSDDLGLASPHTHGFLGKSRQRYADINGAGIGSVLSKVGWEFERTPFRGGAFISADNGLTAVGAAWAWTVQDRHERRGCNLSYAIDMQHQGLGLARLVTAAAFIRLMEHPLSMGLDFVNVQTRQDNLRAQQLALALGMHPSASRGFDCTVPGEPFPRHYVGFEADPLELLEKARALCLSRMEMSGEAEIAADKATMQQRVAA
jgi:hypothetical protein